MNSIAKITLALTFFTLGGIAQAQTSVESDGTQTQAQPVVEQSATEQVKSKVSTAQRISSKEELSSGDQYYQLTINTLNR